MLTWSLIALALVLVAFLLPYIFLRSQLAEERVQRANEQAEIKLLKRAKERLESHLEKDRRIFLSALGVAFILVRPSGRLVVANHEAVDLLDLKDDETVNFVRHERTHPLHDHIAAAVAMREPVSELITFHYKEKEFVYQMTATPMRTIDRHIGIVFHNMTEEHKTMVIRREFVTNASHELRTPLTIIRGYLENLIEDPELAADPAMRTHALTLMKKHSDRILRLVEDMLTISHLENTEKQYLRCRYFKIKNVVEDVIIRLTPMMEQQDASCKINILPQDLEIFGDPFYWSQVLFNLIENALKNNPTAGLIIHVDAQMLGEDKVQIRVIDNGRGIRKDALPFIFNRFYRADDTGVVKGTGLGLSIVRNAVESHGGTIRVESEVGLRTAFIIDVPRGAGEDNKA